MAGRGLLEVDGLTVGYRGDVTALQQVDLSVEDGDIVAVLGANGAGKTTLLRAISGVLDRHHGVVRRGAIRFDGEDLAGRDSADIVRCGVVQVPEGRRVFADLTVDENLRLGGHAVGDRDRNAGLERVRDLFPRLADRRNIRAGLLSGGEQQMLAMGRALMANPRLLLLDEPSLGLAPNLVELVGEIVHNINASGVSVLLIEQNATMGLSVADHAVLLEVGRVRLAGDAEDLAATDIVRDRYLGVGGGGSGMESSEESRSDGEASLGARPPAASHRQDADSRQGHVGAAEVTAQPADDATRRQPPLVRTEGLTVQFGGLKALDDVTLELEPGRIQALIGPNGAGKSTCINVLCGVVRPDRGTVRLGDVDLATVQPHELAGLGMARTFQNLSLSPNATVLQSLLVGRHAQMRSGVVSTALRLPRARQEEEQQRELARRIASEVGLEDMLDVRVDSLPYGDRKRVELARALCAEPDVLLLDEPVAGMTHGESQDMAAAIRTTHRLHGLSILVVEHDMAFVMDLVSHVTVLDFGRRIADGTPQEIQADPAVQAAYLGVAAA